MSSSLGFTAPHAEELVALLASAPEIPLARLVLTGPDMGEKSITLVAGTDVEKVGPLGKIGSALEFLLLGQSGN